MPLPDQTPRLPKWPFLIGDAALLGAAWLIADRSGQPLQADAAYAIAGCGVCAIIAGAIPFLSDYARRQDEALDERQRSLEALARTVSAAAEQISIAAGGFNEIAEIAQKNIRHAEQLPQKLHEKIAEFQARLALATDEEKEELEREVAALRSSESERLESIADKVARAAADWAKVESAAQRQLNAAKALFAQFDESISRFEKRAGRPGDGIASPTAESKSAAPMAAAPKHSAQPDETVPAQELIPAAPSPGPAALEAKEAAPASPGPEAKAEPAGDAPGQNGTTVRAERKRTPKRPAVVKAPANAVAAAPAADPGHEAKAEAPAQVKPSVPAPSDKARGKRPEPDPSEPLGLEFSQASPDDGAPAVAVSADGSTRLLVTAYIGIGNRLFIRGEGPGLSWDKGVPLQFLSIGRWSWETPDATAPVKFKLYKNDDTEFRGLNPPPLEPGKQMEMTATV